MKKSIVYAIFLGIGIIIGGVGGRLLDRGPHFKAHDRYKMNLTKEERDQVRSLYKGQKEEVKTIVESMEAVSSELRLKIKDEGVDEAELRELFKKYHDLRQELTDKRFEINLKIRKQLGVEKMKDLDLLGPVPGQRGPRTHKKEPPRSKEEVRRERR